jgi:hypothetical protein
MTGRRVPANWSALDRPAQREFRSPLVEATLGAQDVVGDLVHGVIEVGLGGGQIDAEGVHGAGKRLSRLAPEVVDPGSDGSRSLAHQIPPAHRRRTSRSPTGERGTPREPSIDRTQLVELTDLKYPWQRTWIVEALKSFADPEYQRRAWADERGRNPDVIENLDVNIDTLYEDTGVARDPRGCIGINLRNEREARAIEDFDRVFSAFYDSLEPGLDDAAIISMPGWAAVVTAAKQALSVFAEDSGLDASPRTSPR